MRFYTIEWKSKLPANAAYPYMVLMNDNWNDYGYVTSFHVIYYDSMGTKTEIGVTKILNQNQSDTKLPTVFDRLPEEYCSLGQTFEYYELIYKLRIDADLLIGINDVVFNKAIASKFVNLKGFQNSLLRNSEAQKIFEKALKYNSTEEALLSFSFKCQVPGADEEHKVDLNFSKNVIPHRINAFVGKNATGKTKVMTDLARYLSGEKPNRGNLQPKRPSFSKIIAISYSSFDELNKPFEMSDRDIVSRKDEIVFFSYVYCGLRTSKGLISEQEIATNFFSAYAEVEKRNRTGEWKKIIQNVLDYGNESLIDKIRETSFNSFLSSGQQILLFIITQVIANIEEESFLLFDEPEIHLHPNAISNFMRMFYEILHTFNSYAIIATHSPLILQEIPSKYVRVFNRTGNVTSINMPFIECFGENISNITNEIFEVREHESNYKTYFRKIVNEYSKEEIEVLFDNELSFNALTYLNSLYFSKNKKEGRI